MFGYIIADLKELPEQRRKRFKALYCGLCRTLKHNYGLTGSATLSYDLTFLAILLNALYEPEELSGRERCIPHPTRTHEYVTSPVMDYVAAMNVALAYHKCLDNWHDDRNMLSAAEGRLLKRAYHQVEEAYSGRCEAIVAWLGEIHALESANALEIDLAVNATGRLLGELFVYPGEETWSGALRAIGNGLGRFVYFMDAYDDLPQDMKKGRYNPLKALKDRADYEELCRSAMMMMVADATEAFERLPVVLDADIIRNVLYSGVWSRYAYLQGKRKRKASKGAE